MSFTIVLYITIGTLIPFLGTMLGSGAVFFMRHHHPAIKCILAGFSGGVMIAASVWSLIIPAVEQSAQLGSFSFIPAATGIMLGAIFMALIGKLLDYIDIIYGKAGLSSVPLAVTIHNLPEGMAVGVAYAAAIFSGDMAAITAATVLSIGIAIQDIPEGAIISMPLACKGISRTQAFLYGTASGAPEPIGAILALLASGIFLPILPYLLCFAAGVMIYVTADELIPEMHGEHSSPIGLISLLLGFCLMMSLDIALG
jgi:ZIP family zinc transporter